MKIISPFRDYYDSVQSFGYDESSVYQRKPKLITDFSELRSIYNDMLPWNANSIKGVYRDKNGPLSFTLSYMHVLPNYGKINFEEREKLEKKFDITFLESYIIIAGKSYPVWLREDWLAKANNKDFHKYKSMDTKNITFKGFKKDNIYGHPNLIQALKDWQNQLFKKYPKCKNIKPRFHFNSGYLRKKDEPKLEDIWSCKDIHKFLEKYVSSDFRNKHNVFLNKDFTELHVELNSPILLIQPGYIVKNSKLKCFKVETLLDTYSLFQNINQMIDGVLINQEKPTITVEDKYKITEKGFDPKYGFRTRTRPKT